jgi:hypothetical protein
MAWEFTAHATIFTDWEKRSIIMMVENNNETDYSEPTPEEMAKIRWQRKALYCSQSVKSHSWMPISWTKTDASSHVAMLMCTQCFHAINLSDARQYSISG